MRGHSLSGALKGVLGFTRFSALSMAPCSSSAPSSLAVSMKRLACSGSSCGLGVDALVMALLSSLNELTFVEPISIGRQLPHKRWGIKVSLPIKTKNIGPIVNTNPYLKLFYFLSLTVDKSRARYSCSFWITRIVDFLIGQDVHPNLGRFVAQIISNDHRVPISL